MQVTLIAAMSVDGFIAQETHQSSFNWTSSEDKQFYVKTIKEIKTIIMGSTSFKTFSRYPKDLRFIIYTSAPETFVNPKPHIIQAEGTNESPAALLDRLEEEGVTEVAVAGGASIYSQFIASGRVDRLLLTVEPVLFGQGVKIFNTSLEIQLELKQIHHLSDQTKVMEYLLGNRD